MNFKPTTYYGYTFRNETGFEYTTTARTRHEAVARFMTYSAPAGAYTLHRDGPTRPEKRQLRGVVKPEAPTTPETPAESLTALLDASHGRVLADTIPKNACTMLRVWVAGQDEHGHVIRDVTDEVADVLALRMDGRYLRLPGAGFVPTWELGRLLDERLTLRHTVSFL